MSKKTDSNSYTMIFAVGMVLVVGSLLAFLASSLKPNIDENKRIEKQQNIVRRAPEARYLVVNPQARN